MMKKEEEKGSNDEGRNDTSHGSLAEQLDLTIAPPLLSARKDQREEEKRMYEEKIQKLEEEMRTETKGI